MGQSHLLWLTRRPFFLNEGKDEVSLRLCRHPERSRAEHGERESMHSGLAPVSHTPLLPLAFKLKESQEQILVSTH